MMKKVNESLFRAICLSFSAVLLVMSLLCSIRYAAARDEVRSLQREVNELEEANAILRASYESSVSLEEIERYATQVLGMQRCSAGQIIYIEYEDMGA